MVVRQQQCIDQIHGERAYIRAAGANFAQAVYDIQAVYTSRADGDAEAVTQAVHARLPEVQRQAEELQGVVVSGTRDVDYYHRGDKTPEETEHDMLSNLPFKGRLCGVTIIEVAKPGEDRTVPELVLALKAPHDRDLANMQPAAARRDSAGRAVLFQGKQHVWIPFGGIRHIGTHPCDYRVQDLSRAHDKIQQYRSYMPKTA